MKMILKTIFILAAILSQAAGSILDCCRQGQRIGKRPGNVPVCVEKNINYKLVQVTKKMCKNVFMSCCHYSAMERYCKAGVQASINGIQCEAASQMGGDMKMKCCECCQQGLQTGFRGDSCDAGEAREMLCKDSFVACCNHAQVKQSNSTGGVSPTKAPDCKAAGCQHSCSSSGGDIIACLCNNGYALQSNGKSCADIDECKDGSARCDVGSMCQNQQGSYLCVKRPVEIKEKPCTQQGYIRNAKGVCVDEDECSTGSAKCTQGTYCYNADGYFACLSTCPYGYQIVGKRCQDIDECARGTICQKHYKCVNTLGYYQCQLASCRRGYELKNGKCEDIDECARRLHNCGPKFTCKNTDGSFECQLSSCSEGFKLVNGKCQDVNECTRKGICGKGQCYNHYGSFSCGCYAGYQLNARTKRCEDIDECKRSPGICESGCINTEGSFKCSCPRGYQSVGDNCEDIDECSLAGRKCPDDHVCVNEYGNYTCINSTCPNQYYILRSPYECRLMCPGNHGPCSNMIIQSIKWRATKFRKFVYPRGYKFTYTLRVSSYLRLQIHFALKSGNENRDFFLQRRDEHSVDVINIKKLIGPKRYTLRLDADVLYQGKEIFPSLALIGGYTSIHQTQELLQPVTYEKLRDDVLNIFQLDTDGEIFIM